MSSFNNDSSYRFSGIADFAIRKQRPTLPQILIIFLTALLICLTVTALSLSKLPLIIFLFLFLAALGSYMIVLLQRSRDLVMTTEFQNALFASALDSSRSFCLIIKYDGNLVYMDRAFQKIFPEFVREGHLSLTHFLQHAKVVGTELEKIFDAVERNTGDKVICSMFGSDGKLYKLVISIEPIPRPAGFIMLHAREYIEKRHDTTAPAVAAEAILSKSSLALLSGVLDTMQTGMYIMDAAGAIMYANSVLENWLAYRTHDIAQGQMTLKDLVHYDQTRSEAITPADFQGEALFKKKNGDRIKLLINQKIISGEDGQPLGSIAMLHMIADKNAETKMKLW